MSFWRKIQIKIRNKLNNYEYRNTLKRTLLIILVLFLILMFDIIKTMIKTNSYDKVLPWLKMLLFSTSIVLGVILLISVIPGLILFKLYKLKYNEKSMLVWFPVINIYLLGKLTVNKYIGMLLILGFIGLVSLDIPIKSNGIMKFSLPLIFDIVYLLIVIVLFIYAIIKCIKLNSR